MPRSLIEPPLFDQAQIALLRDALGQEDLRAMLSELPNAAARARDKMGAALASNDLEEARRVAHALKGVASSFGAARLAAVAGEFDLEATSNTSITQRMSALTNVIDKTVAAMPELDRPASAGAKL